LKVAVVGATGVVGETILRILEERNVEIDMLAVFASRARPNAVTFRGVGLDVHATTEEALRNFDVVFFASTEDASEQYAPALIEQGTIVIDNSSTFRAHATVPLIIPEVNPDAAHANHRVFPVANCTAIVLCVALAPVAEVAGLEAVRVATYQAASGAGRAGLDELLAGELAIAQNVPEPQPHVFPVPLARNVIPQIGSFDDDGWSGEELKVAAETRKMLELPKLRISATTVRVPVRTAHSEAIFIKTSRKTSVEELAAAFERAPGVVFHRKGIITPREVEGTDLVHVARLRAEEGSRKYFTFWAVGDQLRKGAATNAVQILQLLQKKGFVRG
jgi:aspartate-semialdehyde dehydrogenase